MRIGAVASERAIPAAMTRAALCVLAALCAAATAFVVPTPPITPSTRRAPLPVCSEDDPFPERDAEPPRPQTRSSVAPSGAITLSNEVKAILRENNLKDPSEFNQAETDKFVYGAGAGALLVFLLPLFEVGFVGDFILSSLFGGGALAYAQLRKDQVGDAAGQVGSYSLQAVERANAINREYKITEKAKTKLDGLVGEIKKICSER